MKTKWSFLWMTASTKGTKDKIFQIFQKKAQKAQKTSSKYLPNPQTKEIIQRIVTLYVTKYSLWKNWNPSKVIKGNFPIFGKSRWNIRVWQQSVRKVIWLKCIGLKLTANLEKSLQFMQSNICKQSRPASMIISLHESLTGQQEKEFRIFQEEATTWRWKHPAKKKSNISKTGEEHSSKHCTKHQIQTN